jgi:hypothetical protein
MQVTAIHCKDVNYIKLDQDRDQQQALVFLLLKLQVSLTQQAAIRCFSSYQSSCYSFMCMFFSFIVS